MLRKKQKKGILQHVDLLSLLFVVLGLPLVYFAATSQIGSLTSQKQHAADSSTASDITSLLSSNSGWEQPLHDAGNTSFTRANITEKNVNKLHLGYYSYQSSIPNVGGLVTSSDGSIIFSKGYDGYLYAASTASGQVVWKSKNFLGPGFTTPISISAWGQVAVETNDNNGAALWFLPQNCTSVCTETAKLPLTGSIQGGLSPVYANNDNVLIVATQTNVYAINPNYTIKWSYPIAAVGSPAIYNHTVIIATSSALVELAIDSGNPLGTSNTYNFQSVTPVILNGSVYIMTSNGLLLQWNITTRTIVNQIQLGTNGAQAKIAVNATNILVANPDTITDLTPSLTVIWQKKYYSPVTSPVIVGNILFAIITTAPNQQGAATYVYAFNATGQVIWQLNTLGLDAFTSITAVNKALYLGNNGFITQIKI